MPAGNSEASDPEGDGTSRRGNPSKENPNTYEIGTVPLLL